MISLQHVSYDCLEQIGSYVRMDRNSAFIVTVFLVDILVLNFRHVWVKHAAVGWVVVAFM